MRNTAFLPHESPYDLAELVERHGGPVSTALLDPSCEIFRAAGIVGAIGYRRGLGGGCAVAIGDPVCTPDDMPDLLGAFRERFSSTVFAAAGAAFAELATARGYASIEFGEELIFNPKDDACRARPNRELRKKLNRARKEGVVVSEYRRDLQADPHLEQAITDVSRSWLGARRGPQIYLARVELFDPPRGKRWFHARLGERIVGVLSTMHLGARGGYLLDHLMAVPDAPGGTTELLVCEGLDQLGREGCTFATFGPAPAAELGSVTGMAGLSQTIGRKVFAAAGRMFHFDSRTRYRKKFGIARTEPAYILVDPPSIGVRQLVGVMRAFNVSLA